MVQLSTDVRSQFERAACWRATAAMSAKVFVWTDASEVLEIRERDADLRSLTRPCDRRLEHLDRLEVATYRPRVPAKMLVRVDETIAVNEPEPGYFRVHT